MTKNIVLVGFMGAGKSVVAKRLASLFNRSLVSTDEMIIAREGKPINDIFRDLGEAYFRSAEEAVVSQVCKQNDLVVDCGGGVVLNHKNVSLLRENGIVFYLLVSPEVVYQRVKGQGHRPLLKVENPKAKVEELMQIRQTHYEQTAHHIIDTSSLSIEQVVERIKGLIDND